MGLFDELDGVPTYTVSELGAELQGLLREAYASVWVVGEVQRITTRTSGHRYFELVEKGAADEIVGKLDAVVWRGDFARIAPALARHAQTLTEGVTIRCRVQMDFYPPHGRLQLHVKEIDPIFTLGELARRRAETLAEIERLGLAEANRGRPFPELPLRVALVTSEGSAAYHDFVATLAESGYAFRVLLLDVTVQGLAAERAICSALAAAGGAAVDCVALVRGGGARSDLAAFDSRGIALAVARCALPVLTGLGHEVDESVADRVAHRAFKTPTKVAEFLVERLAGSELAVVRLRERLAHSARLPLGAARERVLDAERRLTRARGALERAAARLSTLAERLGAASRRALRSAAERRRQLAQRLAGAAPSTLGRSRHDVDLLVWRIAGAARTRLGQESERLQGRARLVAGLAPARTLARGYSITRGGDGRVLRDPASVGAGERLTTTLARGELTSRVEEP